MHEQRFFEDFTPGEQFHIPSKTLTETHFLLFAGITGDNHPLHYDINYCQQRGFRERVAHGYLVAVMTVLGASLLAGSRDECVRAVYRLHSPLQRLRYGHLNGVRDHVTDGRP